MLPPALIVLLAPLLLQEPVPQPVVPDWTHLVPSPDWVFYALPRSPGERPPYLVACPPHLGPDDPAATRVRANNFERFLAEQDTEDGGRARIPSAEAAREALAVVTGGRVVPDEEAGLRAIKTARATAESVGGVELSVTDHVPVRYGTNASSARVGWEVGGVFLFTEPSLVLAEVAGRVLPDGRVRLKQAWVMSVPVLPEQEPDSGAARTSAVGADVPDPPDRFALFKHGVAAALDERRTIRTAVAAVEEGATREELEAGLGPPDEIRERGAALLFELQDGEALFVRFDPRGSVLRACRLARRVGPDGGTIQTTSVIFPRDE